MSDAAAALRQVVVFLLGVGILLFDIVSAPPHDWVAILLALVLMGTVPAEILYTRLHNGAT